MILEQVGTRVPDQAGTRCILVGHGRQSARAQNSMKNKFSRKSRSFGRRMSRPRQGIESLVGGVAVFVKDAVFHI